MITVKEHGSSQEMSAIQAVYHLIMSTFELSHFCDYEATISDTEIVIKRISSFFGDKTTAYTGSGEEMEKLVLAARILQNKAGEHRGILKEKEEWLQFRFNTLLQVLNIAQYEWRCSGLKLQSPELTRMLEFAAKFPEMKFGDAVDVGRRFYATLDQRLMDLATRPGHEMILTVDEYHTWQYGQRLDHVGETRVIRDCVAASIQDAWGMNACRVHDLLIMPRPDDSVWAKHPT